MRDNLLGFPIFFAFLLGSIWLFRSLLPYPWWFVPAIIVLFIVICILAVAFGDPSMVARRVDSNIVYGFRSPYGATRFARLNGTRITRHEAPTFNWREQF